jgi:hypothetical protein
MKVSEISLSSMAMCSVTAIMTGSYGNGGAIHPPEPVDPSIKSTYLPRHCRAEFVDWAPIS